MPHNSAFGVGRAILPAAAMNGLGLLGILRSDPSCDLWERAACNLADAGMLWRDLRRNAELTPQAGGHRTGVTPSKLMAEVAACQVRT